MDEGRNAMQPNKPDKNEVWSWVVIAILFAFAWPVGLIVLISKLSDSSKRKKGGSGAQQTITAPQASAQTASAQPGTRRTTRGSITRTPQLSDRSVKILRTIGSILTVIGSIVLFKAVADNLFFLQFGNWSAFLEYTFFPMGLTAGGLGLLLGSHWMRRRLRRYGKYLAIAGTKQTVTISQLAAAADVSPRRVENDLEQMVQRGLWGKEAYLDLGRGVLVRSFAAAEDMEKEQEQKEDKAAPVETEQGCSGQLRDIRRANDRIADPVISAKIDRLEDLAGKIFRIVEEEPEKKPKASTFLNYYLPTTQKLLDSYADFEESGVSGENVSQAKQRIADTMDKIVAAAGSALSVRCHGCGQRHPRHGADAPPGRCQHSRGFRHGRSSGPGANRVNHAAASAP